MSPNQASMLLPMNPHLIANMEADDLDNITRKRGGSRLWRKKTMNNSWGFNSKDHWFPTPENCPDPSLLTGINRTIYDTLCEFKEKEKIDPSRNANERKQFLDNFDWEGTLLKAHEKEQLEDLLVEFNDVFAKHRLDIGTNTEFKVKLTPEHNDPVYTQPLPTPLNLKDEIMVELAVMQYYGIIKPLAFSKYASPLFAQRKPNGKLRMLVDLRRINHLLRHDYNNNNFPVSTLADAGQHLAGKKYFCKLDCSQAYFSIQLADELSVQLLAFNFAGRTFAFQRLAQGLSRSMSAFSSFVRKHLDPVIIANMCFQYVDDIASAARTVAELLHNLRGVFEALRNAGLKLTMQKCQFGMPKIDFLGSSITSQGISANEVKVQKFLQTMKMPHNEKGVKRFLGFMQFFRTFIPNLSEKAVDFYQLLQKDNEFRITEKHKEDFKLLKQDLANACKITLRLPIKDAQYVILADASFYAAGFVLMIEDHCEESKGKEKVRYAPVSFGSKVFTPSQVKMSIYAKEFLAVHYAFDTFAHLLWGITSKPVLVLTDNKSLTRFFQAKRIPAPLWNCVDQVLSFNFVLGHIPGRANIAADYISRMYIDPETKFSLKIKERIPLRSIEVNIEGKTPENSLSEIQNDQRKERFEEEEYVDETHIDGEVTSLILPQGVQAFNQMDRNEILAALVEPDPADTQKVPTLKANMLLEQAKDEYIITVKDWIEKKITKPDVTYKHFELRKYAKQLPRLTIVDGILYRKFFDDTGQNYTKQLCVPVHLRQELLYRLHNSPQKGHIGITKMAMEFRQKFYFPGFTEHIVEYAKNCQSCLQVKPIKRKDLQPQLQPVASLQSMPGDMMQIDIVGKLPLSGSYTHVLTGIDVFSKYLFAVPMTKVDAVSVAQALVSLFLRHSYIPTVIVTDLGSVFTSNLLTELTYMLEIRLRHATLKHAQTIGLLEKSHEAFKRVLKLYENPTHKTWHQYVNVATFVHNTTYHTALGCTPSHLFHGREPHGALDMRFGNANLRQYDPQYPVNIDTQSRMLELFEHQKENAITTYNKYRTYYDQKADAKPLAVNDYCLLLNPRVILQAPRTSKMETTWLPTYKVEKKLTNHNYIVRKVGTRYTQCVHRVRLRPFQPKYAVADLPPNEQKPFVADPTTKSRFGEPFVFDSTLPELLRRPTPPKLPLPTEIGKSYATVSMIPASTFVVNIPSRVNIQPDTIEHPQVELETPEPQQPENNGPVDLHEQTLPATIDDALCDPSTSQMPRPETMEPNNTFSKYLEPPPLPEFRPHEPEPCMHADMQHEQAETGGHGSQPEIVISPAPDVPEPPRSPQMTRIPKPVTPTSQRKAIPVIIPSQAGPSDQIRPGVDRTNVEQEYPGGFWSGTG
jgi:hypothetical protein